MQYFVFFLSKCPVPCIGQKKTFEARLDVRDRQLSQNAPKARHDVRDSQLITVSSRRDLFHDMNKNALVATFALRIIPSLATLGPIG